MTCNDFYFSDDSSNSEKKDCVKEHRSKRKYPYWYKNI